MERKKEGRKERRKERRKKEGKKDERKKKEGKQKDQYSRIREQPCIDASVSSRTQTNSSSKYGIGVVYAAGSTIVT